MSNVSVLSLNQTGGITAQTVNTNPIVQTQKHGAMGDKYGFVNTSEVIKIFEANGWQVTKTDVAKTRRIDKIGYQKHLIRLEHPNFPSIEGLTKDNNSKVQICLLNSHDGTTALRMFLGVLRIACLNGLIAGVSLKDFRAVHSKSITKRIDDGIKYLTDNIPTLIATVQALQNTSFTEANFQTLVKTVVDTRLANVGKIVSIDYESAYRIRRDADAATDAFTLANRIQESLIKGGIQYVYEREVKDANGTVIHTETRNATTRRLASVASQVKLNRTLWDTAVRLAG